MNTAQTLREALPYMRRHAGRTFVIKYGGNAMSNSGGSNDGKPSEGLLNFARDVVLLRQVGINVIVVHGGGPQISGMLDKLDIQSERIDGIRVTSNTAVEVAEMVLSGTVNKAMVASICHEGGTAIGINGKDGNLIKAEQLHERYGYVGKPTLVNPQVLSTLQASNMIPVIAPIAGDDKGNTWNLNADTAAGAIAAAVAASRFFLLTDVAGVLDKNGDLIPDLTPNKARELIKNGTITGGMIPKIETCIDAIEKGVRAAVILDGRLPHGLLLEIFTESGAGTIIKQG